MLRDWTCSDKINELTAQAERFFTRLIMKADDYGCFHARPNLLKANLFPLLLDSIREADLLRWLTECQKAGLVVLYEHSGKDYLQIVDFNQRKRIMKRTFPDPTTCGLPADISLTVRIPEQEVEEEREDEVEEEGGEQVSPPSPEDLDFIKFLDWIRKKSPRVLQMKESFTIDQYLEIKKDFTAAEISNTLQSMHNWEPLLKKNRSPYLTLIKWIKKDEHATTQRPINSINRKLAGANQLAGQISEEYNT